MARVGKQCGFFTDLNAVATGQCSHQRLAQDCRDDRHLVQRLSLLKSVRRHSGCVNTISWSDDGEYLLSGSDDRNVVVLKAYDYQVREVIAVPCSSNIFCARFMPDTGNMKIVSCAGSGVICLSDIGVICRPELSHFLCHSETAYEVLPLDSNCFFSCSEDKTVRFFDVRVNNSCHDRGDAECNKSVLLRCSRPASTIALEPTTRDYLAVGTGDSAVRIYDRRRLSPLSAAEGVVAKFTARGGRAATRRRESRVTSLCYSANGNELLASFWSDNVYLLSVRDRVSRDYDDEDEHNNDDDDGGGDVDDDDSNRRDEDLGECTFRRLRLRGDWSDTGPNATLGEDSPESTRMTSILSNMFRAILISRLRQKRLRLRQQRDQQQPGEPAAREQGSSNPPGGPEFPRAGCSAPDSDEEVSMKCLKEYTGHRNARTMIKEACFWGSKFVMSGSDCGHIFVWDKGTGEHVMMLEADRRVVNCVQPHPTLPMFASSGIDYDVKFWAPVAPEPGFDEAEALKLRDKNKIMLEATRDTMTVPLSVMVRTLNAMHVEDLRQANEDTPESMDSTDPPDS